MLDEIFGEAHLGRHYTRKREQENLFLPQGTQREGKTRTAIKQRLASG
jgi:hypothetical protein